MSDSLLAMPELQRRQVAASNAGINGRVSANRFEGAPKSDDCDCLAAKVLLTHRIAVHGDQDVESSVNGFP